MEHTAVAFSGLRMNIRPEYCIVLQLRSAPGLSSVCSLSLQLRLCLVLFLSGRTQLQCSWPEASGLEVAVLLDFP